MDGEVHTYVRHTTHLLVWWFTFFGTANIVAIGWSAFRLKDGIESGNQQAILIIGLFFIVQGILGFLVGRYMLTYFYDTEKYFSEIQSTRNSEVPQAPSAILLYWKLTWLMRIALLSFEGD